MQGLHARCFFASDGNVALDFPVSVSICLRPHQLSRGSGGRRAGLRAALPAAFLGSSAGQVPRGIAGPLGRAPPCSPFRPWPPVALKVEKNPQFLAAE